MFSLPLGWHVSMAEKQKGNKDDPRYRTSCKSTSSWKGKFSWSWNWLDKFMEENSIQGTHSCSQITNILRQDSFLGQYLLWLPSSLGNCYWLLPETWQLTYWLSLWPSGISVLKYFWIAKQPKSGYRKSSFLFMFIFPLLFFHWKLITKHAQPAEPMNSFIMDE